MDRTWWQRHPIIALLALAALMLPPLLVNLGAHGPGDMEELAVASSQETWLALHNGDADAWIIPTLNGKPRVVKPPLLVWLNLIAWTGMTPETSSPDDLLLRARLVTVACSVVLMVAVFALGGLLGGARLALMSAVAAALNLMTQEAGRVASYDVQLAMWSALAVTAGCWAMHPFDQTGPRRIRWRRWTLCGVAMALAVLTKGPVAFFFILLPLALMLAMLARFSLHALLGVLVALLVSVVVVAPWFVYVLLNVARSAGGLFREYQAQGVDEAQSIIYYPLRLLQHTNPWSVWLVVGAFLPLLKPVRTRLPASMIPAVWLWIVIIVLSCAPSVVERYIIPALAAIALVCGWGMHLALANDANKPDGPSRLLSIVHWIALAVCSARPASHALGVPESGRFVDAEWVIAVITSVLLILCVTGIGCVLRRRSWPTLLALTVMWAAIFHTWLWHDRAIQPDRHDLARGAAEQVLQAAGGVPLAYFREAYRDAPRYDFLYYARRAIPPVRQQDFLDALAAGQDTPPMILARIGPGEERDTMLRDAGYDIVLRVDDGTGRGEFRLWRLNPAHTRPSPPVTQSETAADEIISSPGGT